MLRTSSRAHEDDAAEATGAHLGHWGDRWEAGEAGPPALLVHDRCGEVATPETVCGCCGLRLEPDEVTGIAGPGGRLGPGTTVIGPILAARAEAHRLP